MINKTIAFIGAGNMGSSFIGGLLANGLPATSVWAAAPDAESLQALKQRFGIHVTTNNAEAVKHANVIILAVKPKVMTTVLNEIASSLNAQQLVISVATGVKISQMTKCLHNPMPIVRSMPNIAALVGASATALVANQHVNEEQRNVAESILRAIGLVVWLEDEKLIDTVTALSGSGPAYFFRIMEVMVNSGMSRGLSREQAEQLTIQTVLGAARLALESSLDIKALRHKIMVPGGTTEAGIKVLEDAQIDKIFDDVIARAEQRAIELSQLAEQEDKI